MLLKGLSLYLSLLLFRLLLEAPADLTAYILTNEAIALIDGRAYLILFGIAVDLYHQTLKTQQRSSSLVAGVKAGKGLLHGLLHHQGTELGFQGSLHGTLDLLQKHLGKTFIELQDHIPREGFRKDYVRLALGDLPGFDASDEIDGLAFF